MRRLSITFDPATFHAAMGLPQDVKVAGFQASENGYEVTVLLEGLSDRFAQSDEPNPVTIEELDGFGTPWMP